MILNLEDTPSTLKRRVVHDSRDWCGRLGNRTVQRLVDEGREVVGSDRRPCPENFPTTFIETDLCDHTSAWHVADGADAIVHMGAIPGPGADPDETFHNNMMSTFHVMRAAQEHGTRRIVFSSSAFGMGWAHDPAAFVPDYLPLDEDHLMMPFEPYGLTKQLGEGIGAMVARSSATTVVSLRFTNVVSPERQQEEFPWEAPTRQNPRTHVMWPKHTFEPSRPIWMDIRASCSPNRRRDL